MAQILNQDRRRRRTREPKRTSMGELGIDHTAFGYLVNVAIKLSESEHRIGGPGLLRVVGVDQHQKSRPPRSCPLPGWRDPYQSRSRGPRNAFDEHLLQLHLTEQCTLEEYASRIDRLRLIVEEEEDRTINRDSESDFWYFVHRHPFAQSGQLVVTDEGHIRLVWKGDNEAHIGIRFLGDRRVRYVIFNRRPGERELSESSGEDTFDGLVGQAHAYGIQAFRA